LTAQNTLGVQDIFVVPSEFVRKQINAGLEDVGADVVKLGQSFWTRCMDELFADPGRNAVIRRDD
jgi:hydroxymethylpyrimidine/phosphomethylpyrimidine kinase